MRLPDAATSRAVVIGVAGYTQPELPDLPAVSASAQGFSSVLFDARYGGIPAGHGRTLLDPASPQEVETALMAAAAEATDLLLIYYAGHALTGLRADELFLGVRDTDP